ncbi:hypothetical protein C8R44DRAFT_732065 [Mycena epipterygia]|nr:hypothetical protein C8R44DRAFT_732065 [Mycena epipterygia]
MPAPIPLLWLDIWPGWGSGAGGLAQAPHAFAGARGAARSSNVNFVGGERVINTADQSKQAVETLRWMPGRAMWCLVSARLRPICADQGFDRESANHQQRQGQREGGEAGEPRERRAQTLREHGLRQEAACRVTAVVCSCHDLAKGYCLAKQGIERATAGT